MGHVRGIARSEPRAQAITTTRQIGLLTMAISHLEMQLCWLEAETLLR
jgi:hypothetical protein